MGDANGGGWFFLDPPERELVAEVLRLVQAHQPGQHAVLEGALSRLGRLAELIRDSPSFAASWKSDVGSPFSIESLIETLCRVESHDLDLHVPTKAIVGQAYLVAKINFLKALNYALQASGAPPELVAKAEREIAQSIYTKLAEEVFITIVTDRDAGRRVKVGAARFLFRIWEERLLTEVDDFAPLLESAWHARSTLLPILGTLLGTHEVFRLFREARDKQLFDYFGGDDVQEDELLAFEEFVFGLSHEEIQRLRAHMAKEERGTITVDEARALLGDTGTRSAPSGGGAQALYSSYKVRRMNAAHRASTGAHGPKKTAEEYVMIAYLLAGPR